MVRGAPTRSRDHSRPLLISQLALLVPHPITVVFRDNARAAVGRCDGYRVQAFRRPPVRLDAAT